MEAVTWIVSNVPNIFAVIGALYMAARLIVAMTPSTKDDIDFENKVGKPIKAIAALFGLNIEQGR